MERCPWCGTDPLYVDYHDSEWGVPERDPRALWEKLVLDGFQAGLAASEVVTLVMTEKGLNSLLAELSVADQPVIDPREFLAPDAYAPLPTIV